MNLAAFGLEMKITGNRRATALTSAKLSSGHVHNGLLRNYRLLLLVENAEKCSSVWECYSQDFRHVECHFYHSHAHRLSRN